ncbi:hypothetical protein OKA05_07480 [Luteolibacter arcticus]|uniref:DUF2191 domain-containing protein n=1 Tax=Luteolibacter arcticus TaxID=1581411 RepID=A0ABT3GFJ1_9BACT|nr:hypothetical protein [Luteolibacter arcticus]MCW1922390.1 hypothetical protein [Luteolibacter arcticus]
MKTTLELPDELLTEAKATAARRRITLKELFTRALEKELRPVAAPKQEDHFTIDQDGWPVLKRRPDSGVVVTEDFIRQLREQEGV